MLLASGLAAAAALSPVWFVCDAVDRPVAFIVGRPDAAGTAAVTVIDKAGGRGTGERLAIGRDDPGAGQIHNVLSRGGRAVGGIHRVNPGMVDQPADVRPATVTGMTLDGVTAQCRWTRGLVANGVTARRGITITREGEAIVYRSFDFAADGPVSAPDGVQRTTAPSNEIRGGRMLRTADGARIWRFVKQGWLTEVALTPGGGAMLMVSRDGFPVSHEDFLGLAAAP